MSAALSGTHRISVGIVDRSLIHPREVFRPAIKDAAKAVLLVHNHPSGDPTPSDDDLTLTSRLEQDVLVVAFITRQIQDERTAEAILQNLTALIDQYRAGKVVIDLQNIKYVSSVAFRPLLNIRRKLQVSGGRLVLCGLSQVVGDVFYTTRLVSKDGAFAAPFELEPDAAAAIARLNSKEPQRNP